MLHLAPPIGVHSLLFFTPQLPQHDWFFNINSDFLKPLSSHPPLPPSFSSCTRTHLGARQPAEWVSEALLKRWRLWVDWQRAAEWSVVSGGFLSRLQSRSLPVRRNHGALDSSVCVFFFCVFSLQSISTVSVRHGPETFCWNRTTTEEGPGFKHHSVHVCVSCLSLSFIFISLYSSGFTSILNNNSTEFSHGLTGTLPEKCLQSVWGNCSDLSESCLNELHRQRAGNLIICVAPVFNSSSLFPIRTTTVTLTLGTVQFLFPTDFLFIV